MYTEFFRFVVLPDLFTAFEILCGVVLVGGCIYEVFTRK